MGFSLFFWKKNEDSDVKPPALPADGTVPPPMPFVRDMEPGSTPKEMTESGGESNISDRLARIKELLAKLPPPGQPPQTDSGEIETEVAAVEPEALELEAAAESEKEIVTESAAVDIEPVPEPLAQAPPQAPTPPETTPGSERVEWHKQAEHIEIVELPEHHLAAEEFRSTAEVHETATPAPPADNIQVSHHHARSHRRHQAHHEHLPISDDVRMKMEEERPLIGAETIRESPGEEPSVVEAPSEQAVNDSSSQHTTHPLHSAVAARESREEVAREFSETLLPPSPRSQATSFEPFKLSFRPDFTLKASSPFHSCNGGVYWTLEDLGNALVQMDNGAFSHHVNNHKNDFANWVEGCFQGEERSVGHVLRGLDREGMIRLLVRLHAIQEQPEGSSKAPSTQKAQSVFDEKQPSVVDWKPSSEREENKEKDRVRSVLDQLHAARLQALTDTGAAREAFIHARSIAWGELTDEERKNVLPKLRETYNFLRALK